jgi:predicted ATPase
MLRKITLLRDTIENWNEFPFSVPAIKPLRAIEIKSRVLCFVGENGSGKSTLLEALALAAGLGREGGSRNFSFSTRSENRENLKRSETRIDLLADALRLTYTKRQRDGFFLRAESFYNIATYVDTLGVKGLTPYGGISLHDQSHGESFLALLLNRFSGGGLYLLDEPESALSATRQLALLSRMRVLLERDEDTQFIIATHSPILLAYPDAQLLTFDRGTIKPIAYRDTDPYQITRRFLDNPAKMLEELFRD